MSTTGTYYCSVDDVKNQLKSVGIDEITTDPEIKDIIGDMSDQIEKETRRKFYRVVTEERYDGSGQDKLVLDNYPVIEGEAIRIRIYTIDHILARDIQSSDSDFTSKVAINYKCGFITLIGVTTIATISSAKYWPQPPYTLSPYTSTYYDYINHFGVGTSNIIINYVYGYTDTPSSIRRACIKLSAAEILEKKGPADTQGVTTESIAGMTSSFNPAPFSYHIDSWRKAAMRDIQNYSKRGMLTV